MIFRRCFIENVPETGAPASSAPVPFRGCFSEVFWSISHVARSMSLLPEHAFRYGFYSTKRVLAFFIDAAFGANLIRSLRANRAPLFIAKSMKNRAESVPIGRRWPKIKFVGPGSDFGMISVAPGRLLALPGAPFGSPDDPGGAFGGSLGAPGALPGRSRGLPGSAFGAPWHSWTHPGSIWAPLGAPGRSRR